MIYGRVVAVDKSERRTPAGFLDDHTFDVAWSIGSTSVQKRYYIRYGNIYQVGDLVIGEFGLLEKTSSVKKANFQQTVEYYRSWEKDPS